MRTATADGRSRNPGQANGSFGGVTPDGLAAYVKTASERWAMIKKSGATYEWQKISSTARARET